VVRADFGMISMFWQAVNTYDRRVFWSLVRCHAIRVRESVRKRLISRLRGLRELHGITQEQFSELSGFSYKFYQLIEIGKKCDLRLSSLEKLANAYGIEVHELLGPEVPKTHFPKPIPSKQKRKPPRPQKSD
jgi:DNA-binding XRE family transcriptional regulator